MDGNSTPWWKANRVADWRTPYGKEKKKQVNPRKARLQGGTFPPALSAFLYVAQ